MGTDLFPSVNFIPVPSAVEGIDVYQPAPVKLPAHREVVQFNSPQCGANTAYNAADSGLTCTNCGFYEPPEHDVVGIQAERFEFTVDTVQRAAQGWGEARKELQCQSCGAYTTISTDSLTHTCIFCGSNQVIQHAASQDVLRPRFIVPFKIEAEACHDIARQWLGQSWMTPRSLRRVATIAHFTGIYLPFWTFETVTKAHWQAEVGHNQTERYYENGETYDVDQRGCGRGAVYAEFDFRRDFLCCTAPNYFDRDQLTGGVNYWHAGHNSYNSGLAVQS